MTERINLLTKKEFLEKFFLKNHGIIPPISESLSKEDLITLINKHKNTHYEDALLEYVAFHKNVDEEIHNYLLDITNNSSWMGNAIATSGKATRKTLVKLLKHKSKFVVEHAELALKTL